MNNGKINYENIEKNTKSMSSNIQEKNNDYINKNKINYFSYPKELIKNINWDE